MGSHIYISLTMNSQANFQKVTVFGKSDKFKEGFVRIQEWDKKARILRALKSLGLCWGLAIVSILIPIAHFVLVPGFLVAGPILAFFVFTAKSTILGGDSTCPECNSPLTIVK